MNSGTFIILLTALFPTLAILSFLFSLATYFQPPRARQPTQDRAENLTGIEDIIAAIFRDIRAVRRIVDRERQRTRRLENTVREMAKLGRRSGEAAEDAGDEAEREDTRHGEEGQGCYQEGTPVRRSFDIGEFLEEQRIREQVRQMIVRLRLNGTHGSSRNLANGVPHDQFEPRVRIRRGASSSLNNDDALGAASTTEIPPSPEHNYTPASNTPSPITHTVCYDEDGDTPTLSMNGEGHTRTTNRFPQTPRFDTDNDQNHIHTSSPPRHQPTLIHIPPSLSPDLPHIHRPTKITIPNKRAQDTALTNGAVAHTPTNSPPNRDRQDNPLPNSHIQSPLTNRHVQPHLHAHGAIQTRLTNDLPNTNTQITSHPVQSSPASSSRSSRSASLSGITLVNSLIITSLDSEAGVVPDCNPATNGEVSGNVELYRDNACEMRNAVLRRRRGVRDMRRAAREDGRRAERRRNSIEEEMMQHVLGRERVGRADGIFDVEINGVESGESSDREGAGVRRKGSDGE